MSLTIESDPLRLMAQTLRDRRVQRGTIRDRYRRLRVGLVNNMPDAALAATERQFSNLIEAASEDFDIRLTLVALDSTPRELQMREAMAATYRDPRLFRLSSPDAMIVTGAEPRAARLDEEPYWDELTALLDWSRGGLVAALYSCLAAHAAAWHRDRIVRRRLFGKLSGVYESEIVAPHELTEGLTRAFTPHSRFNALAECDLEFKGYLTLTRSDEAGPDVFVRERELLEVFWQGHPEYDRDTLAREFRRDMLRFAKGERAAPPLAPANYFDREASARIEAALQGAVDLESLAAALNPEALSPAEAFWRESSKILMRNWLTAIARRKAQGRLDEAQRARFGG